MSMVKVRIPTYTKKPASLPQEWLNEFQFGMKLTKRQRVRESRAQPLLPRLQVLRID
jgi:hypothetical protein